MLTLCKLVFQMKTDFDIQILHKQKNLKLQITQILALLKKADEGILYFRKGNETQLFLVIFYIIFIAEQIQILNTTHV